MGKKYKIVYDMAGCINAGPCAVANPKHWKMDEELEKAVLIGGVENPKTKNFELIIDEEDLKANMEAARVCPVAVIHIFDLETGEQLI